MEALLTNSVRHELFAQNLARRMPQVKAYELAGFRGETYEALEAHSSRLASQSHIRRRVSEILAPAMKKNQISVERLLEEYALLAYSRIDDAIVIGEDGEPKFDYAGMTREQRAAISEITVEEYIEGRGENARQVKSTKFKMHDKRGAMRDLAQYLKMLGPEATQVNVSLQLITQLQVDDREALLAGLAAMLPGRIIEGNATEIPSEPPPFEIESS